ncbi:MAG: DNA repair protein RadC [Clostridiales bacterium]|jgi:DNA repair protein RadC|nr:DNA repair protein RadC [Clostridiales bacterium]
MGAPGAKDGSSRKQTSGLANNNVHVGHRERVRRRFMLEGLSNFAPHEILELALFYCIPMKDVNELAHEMINAFGDLPRLVEASPQDIMSRCKVNENTAVLVSFLSRFAQQYFQSRWSKRVVLDNFKDAGSYLVNMFMNKRVEAFCLTCLDASRRLSSTEVINEGTIGEAPVYLRNIAQAALLHSASCVILSHNHPGGSRQPSRADISATRQIIDVFSYLDIIVLDHIIVCDNNFFSFAEHNLLNLKYF